MANKPIDSSYLKAQVLKFKTAVLDPLFDAKENKLTWDTTPTASSLNPVTSGGVYSSIDTLYQAVAQIEATSIQLPSGADLNNIFYNGYNASTAACQSMTNVPPGWTTTGIGEMSIKFIPESAKRADGTYSYGTQVVYGETTSGTIGEWRRVWAGSWTTWRTIVDPLDTVTWVDLTNSVTIREDLIDKSVAWKLYATRQNGFITFSITFKYKGSITTGTQQSLITGIPTKFIPSTNCPAYCSGYYSGGVQGCNLLFKTDGSVNLDEISIDNTGTIRSTIMFPAIPDPTT